MNSVKHQVLDVYIIQYRTPTMLLLYYTEPDPCILPMDQGICLGNIQRYFYNTVTQRCEIFFWGGCFGNDNKFNSLHDCEEMCSSK